MEKLMAENSGKAYKRGLILMAYTTQHDDPLPAEQHEASDRMVFLLNNK